MKDAMHRTATAAAIAWTISVLVATGSVAGLPIDDPAPDEVEDRLQDLEGQITSAITTEDPGSMPDPTFGHGGQAMPVNSGPRSGHDGTTIRTPRPDPVTPSRAGTRHVGHRAAADRAVAPAPDTSSEPPVWLPGTAGILVLAAAMYHRMGRDDLLDNQIRAAILDLVEESPGGTVTEYAEAVDVDRTTARYHLRMLERFDYVISDRIRGRTRYFENHGRWDGFARQAIAHLRSRSTRELVAEILEDPGRRCPELAAPTGLSESAVYRKVDRLDEIGLVEVEGRPKRVRPARDAADRVDELVEVAERA